MNGLLRTTTSLLLFIGLTASTFTYAQNTGAAKKGHTYIWTKILDSADWKKSYNFQMFTQHDTAWVFHQDGNWYSTDGRRWVKSSLPNAIYNLAFLDYVQFNNSMYGLGHFEGNADRFTYTPMIYRTNNFKSWTVIARTGNLPARFFYHPFVFNNKLWIIGGANQNTEYADIWNSADGIVWVKQKDNLPFGKRSPAVVNFKGKLYLLNNDVWTSTDGLNWTLLTNEILKGEQLFGYAAVVFDNKIWLLGCNRNGLFSSRVLVSTDGKTGQSKLHPGHLEAE
ncbi:hypothetical protein HK413_12445 [Mucilaginibacter sp. S1162]|uniref:DUF6242 domain-containing protein n=1 Tax=Mucilaginibacter humi TaxID=2732510 RepID=A0ABX1W6J5_9SPHI|nr:hypothetical protein [Mucilaginibacter humi]